MKTATPILTLRRDLLRVSVKSRRLLAIDMCSGTHTAKLSAGSGLLSVTLSSAVAAVNKKYLKSTLSITWRPLNFTKS